LTFVNPRYKFILMNNQNGSTLLFLLLFIVISLFTAIASLSLNKRQALVYRPFAQTNAHATPTPNCIIRGSVCGSSSNTPNKPCCNPTQNSCRYFDGGYNCWGINEPPPYPPTPTKVCISPTCEREYTNIISCNYKGEECKKTKIVTICSATKCTSATKKTTYTNNVCKSTYRCFDKVICTSPKQCLNYFGDGYVCNDKGNTSPYDNECIKEF